MEAIGFDVAGGPEVLRRVTLPDPVAGPGEVVIRVAYAGVNYAEAEHRRGVFGPADGIEVPGLEVSGTVAALGPGVDAFTVGQPVAAYLPAFGGYAGQVAVAAAFVLPLPDGWDLAAAGGFGCIAPTAYGVVAAGRVTAGDTVLVHAAAGGVGSLAGQIARALGAHQIIGTVGDPAKAAHALRSGYDLVLPRSAYADAVLEATGGRGVDVVLDPVGGRVRADSIPLLAPFGRLVAFGNAAGEPDLTLPVQPLWKNNRTVGGYNIGDLARRAPALWRAHALAVLDLVAAGRVRFDIAEIVPIDEAASVHKRLDEGATVGKIVLAVAA
ncbi:quinone oxidoreductase family protein [Hamadaea tsunoensis]|uniref:quinone oxidoreductase family protein n=1 Tax=Hamadaea tsunoensis TaxID=53368 RepID=UPI0003FCC0E8|nr:zinc-binding dehydrogenase [Hamadaea tsunoensis]